ncbi:MAG: peptidoglycan editing factor PgeF [Eubacterium sp.]|nr:peptidoglycan editing factor PgeF [Eubacterium sp.]
MPSPDLSFCGTIYIMKKETINGVPVLVYPELEKLDFIKHCFSTREGGVSSGIFESMNLSFTRGDDEENVKENFHRIASVMEEAVDNFVLSEQTHTTNVYVVTKKDAGIGLTRPKPYTDVDGLITNEPNLVLSCFFADCVPLYIIDVKNKAIGLSHSGWRGTAGRIGKVTIEKMHEEYGTNPEDLICAIGPSICKSCYEISRDVAEIFTEEFKGFEDRILEEKPNDKFLLDLWETNKIVFKEAGVKEENIILPNICTCCNPNLLFSHRASKGKRGNLGAFLCIK